MQDNTLRSLLLVRRLALENARRRFAECLAMQRETDSLLQNARISLASETRVVTLGEVGCHGSNSTSTWFQMVRAEMTHIRVAHERTAAECNLARVEVAGGRGAYEATLVLTDRRKRDSDERRGRSEQTLLDAAAHWRILDERGNATR